MRDRLIVGLIGALSLTLILIVILLVKPRPGVVQVPIDPPRQTFSFAVIGDVPYGASQLAAFANVMRTINADQDVQLVYHLGDIKDGASQCSTSYYRVIKSRFDQSEDPRIYTPGDNEWTDCHRAVDGSYDPLERLAALRKVFFPQPYHALGKRKTEIISYASTGYPENVRYSAAGISFAAIHVIGANNGLAPWTGQPGPTRRQRAEVRARTASAIQVVKDAFASATTADNGSVALMTQADMFSSTSERVAQADYAAFGPIVKTIANEAATFPGRVYLFNGDSHTYHTGTPLADGSPWLELYGLKQPVGNLTQITVDGSTNADNYLKVTVDPRDTRYLSWTKEALRK